MTDVSRHLLHAVLEVRDRRHGETHAALVGMFQALAAEMMAVTPIQPSRLAERLESFNEEIAPDAHGDAAREMIAHVITWLRNAEGAAAVPPSGRWRAPGLPEVEG